MFCPFTSDTYDRAVTALYPKKSKEWKDYLKKYAKDNALDESWAEGAWRNHFRIKKYTYVGTKEVIGVRSLRYRFQEPFSPQQKKFFIPFRDRDVKIKFFPGNKTLLVSQPKWDAYNLLLHVENQIIKALNCINCGWCQIVCNHIDMGKNGKIYIKDSCTGCLKCTYKSPCMVIREGAQINILKESGNDRWGRKTRRVY
jgi:ferredoxin